MKRDAVLARVRRLAGEGGVRQNGPVSDPDVPLHEFAPELKEFSAASFSPLSVREGNRSVDLTLYEGIAPWMHDALLRWLRPLLYGWSYEWEEPVPDEDILEMLVLCLRSPDVVADPKKVLGLASTNQTLFFDVVDAVIGNMVGDSGERDFRNPSRPVAVDDLDRILYQSGSAWRVGERTPGPGYELQRRVNSRLGAEYERAAQSQPEIVERLLSKAWSHAFGRNPSPNMAIDQAIRALEVAMRPVVAPRDHDASLGKMINHLRDGPRKWTTTLENLPERINPIEKVGNMLDLLRVQERHADGTNTQAEAEAVLHLVVVLTQWFSNGTITLRANAVPPIE